MKVKRIISTVLCTGMLLGSLTGCGGETEQPANSTGGNGGTESTTAQESGDKAESDSASFSYNMPNRYKVWLEDLNYWKDMQELSGVKVELVDSGESDDSYYQSIDLAVGSGTLGDAAIVRQSQAAVYGAQGAFMDLKPLIDEKAPNIKAYIEANPDYAAMVTSEGGAIYGLAVENPLYTNLTFYRSDHFEKAGITELPATIDEFTEVLRTLKSQYGSGTGYYPWVGREGYLHFAECFECNDTIDESGKVHGVYNGGNGYDIYADGFKDLVAWYHTLYSEKLIDPEWVAGTGTEEEWQTKFLTGKGSVSDDFFSRPTWFISNGGPDNDPDYNIEVMDLFKTNSGNTARRFQNYVNLDRYLVISEASKNADSVMKFLDWLFSEEGQQVMHYGIDGINTEKQADGSYKWIADFAVEAIRPVGEPNIGVYQDRLTFPYPVDNKSYYESLDSRVQAYCTDYFDQYASYSKQLIYTEAQQEERSNLMAKYNTEFTAGVLSFVKGDTELNDENWKAFLDKMETAGFSQINRIDQEACDSMQ